MNKNRRYFEKYADSHLSIVRVEVLAERYKAERIVGLIIKCLIALILICVVAGLTYFFLVKVPELEQNFQEKINKVQTIGRAPIGAPLFICLSPIPGNASL